MWECRWSYIIAKDANIQAWKRLITSCTPLLSGQMKGVVSCGLSLLGENLKQIVILVIIFFSKKKLTVFNSLELHWWYKMSEIALLLILNISSSCLDCALKGFPWQACIRHRRDKKPIRSPLICRNQRVVANARKQIVFPFSFFIEL